MMSHTEAKNIDLQLDAISSRIHEAFDALREAEAEVAIDHFGPWADVVTAIEANIERLLRRKQELLSQLSLV